MIDFDHIKKTGDCKFLWIPQDDGCAVVLGRACFVEVNALNIHMKPMLGAMRLVHRVN